ncbi:MAG: DUF3078 domain-containing protein [Saprospiraceae bacterium]
MLFVSGTTTLQAQDAEETTPEPPKIGWERGLGLGFDFAQLLQINPKQGAGQNRIGFGGAANFFANNRQELSLWENTAAWQFGLQRLGSGVIAQGPDSDKIPFQKAIDEFRFNSKYGYKMAPNSKWYYAANATFISQITPTYQFPDVYPGNFVSDFIDSGNTPIAKFLAPATATASIGVDYKPSDNLSIYFSPLGAKFIIVANDSIAARGIHGNPVEGERNEFGFFPTYDKVDSQFGALARIGYADKFADDKAAFTSNIILYSNYLRNPQNVDVDWTNSLGYEIFKNFQLNLLVNVFYDDDVNVQITDNDFPNGINGMGKRVSITQQLLLNYSLVF